MASSSHYTLDIKSRIQRPEQPRSPAGQTSGQIAAPKAKKKLPARKPEVIVIDDSEEEREVIHTLSQVSGTCLQSSQFNLSHPSDDGK